MTGELKMAAAVVGLGGAWLVGIPMGTGRHGVLSDLNLGLIGGGVGVWIFQGDGGRSSRPAHAPDAAA